MQVLTLIHNDQQILKLQIGNTMQKNNKIYILKNKLHFYYIPILLVLLLHLCNLWLFKIASSILNFPFENDVLHILVWLYLSLHCRLQNPNLVKDRDFLKEKKNYKLCTLFFRVGILTAHKLLVKWVVKLSWKYCVFNSCALMRS